MEPAVRERAKAFDKLLAHKETVFRVCLGYARNYADAEDLTQESFLRAYRNLDTLSRPESGREWLLAIVRNACIDHGRRNKLGRLLPFLARRAGDRREEPDPAIMGDERVQALKRAVRALPEKHRAVFVLYTYGGLSYREIAASLGLKEGTVMSRLSRARAGLERKIKEVADDDA